MNTAHRFYHLNQHIKDTSKKFTSNQIIPFQSAINAKKYSIPKFNYKNINLVIILEKRTVNFVELNLIIFRVYTFTEANAQKTQKIYSIIIVKNVIKTSLTSKSIKVINLLIILHILASIAMKYSMVIPLVQNIKNRVK